MITTEHSKNTECGQPINGPLGTCVGLCELEENHQGPCRVNGVSECDMLEYLGLLPET
jgi:hypothetical protein